MAVSYLQLIVHHIERPRGAMDCSHAHVVVSAPDLFQALERAIESLRHGGWVVDDLERFSIGINRPRGSSESLLYRLYHEARTEGVAWAIMEINADEPSIIPLGVENEDFVSVEMR